MQTNLALTATGLSPGGYAAQLAKFGYNVRRVKGKIARRVTQSLARRELCVMTTNRQERLRLIALKIGRFLKTIAKEILLFIVIAIREFVKELGRYIRDEL